MKMPRHSPRRTLLVLLLSGAAGILNSQRATAAEPDWPERSVTLHAQEQSLDDFLRQLLQAAGMRALPSDGVQGRISGRFADSPQRIFEDVVEAYDLLPYYDGAVMHVAAGAELQSRSLRVRPADVDRFERALNRSKLADRYQTVQLSRADGLIKLRGAPEFIDAAQALIEARPAAASGAKSRSAPVDAMVFRTFALKYASAADQTYFQNGQELRIPGVVSLLRSMVGGGGPLQASMSSGPAERGRNVPSVRGRGLRRFDRDEAQDEAPAQSSYEAAPGGARIEADPNLNTVLVRDTAQSMAMYQELIAQLDREPQLIEIQVTIVDVNRSKLQELGVDWRYDDRNNSISAGGGAPVPRNGGLLLDTVLGDAGRFLARVDALAQSGAAQVVSRPQVLTLSNLEAVLATDQSFFVRVAGREEVDLFDVSVGTSLRVVPTVAGEANNPQIRLRVAIEDGSLSPDAVVDDIPVVERSTLNTQAVIYDGQSLLLGGLVRDSTGKNTTKVPLLGDIPGVGRLFKRTSDVSASQERLFLIQPRIIASKRPATAAPASAPLASAPLLSAPPAGSIQPASEPRLSAQSPRPYLDGF